MSDDLSKFFPHAMRLIAELEAEAVVVLVVGGKLGGGCAPALILDQHDTPEARKRNSRILRAVVGGLEMVARNLERDLVRSGMPLEPKQ